MTDDIEIDLDCIERDTDPFFVDEQFLKDPDGYDY